MIFAALVLSGCGGGGGDTGGQPTPTSAPSSPSAPSVEQGQKPTQRQSHEQRRQEQQARAPHHIATKPLPPPPSTRRSLPNQGTKTVAPGVPTEKGGDNSIQSYGLESRSVDRLQAASIVKAYLDAQAAGRWSEACSYLTAELHAKLEALALEAEGSSAQGCPQTMEAFLANTSTDALRTVADIEAISMRVQGSRAFLIYKDGEGSTAELVMAREGGEWKVGALVGNALAVRGEG